ncbi:gluconokinase [Actinokineospora alba]|uniref:Gluconokinase n=1 Tax=Actinokineospora alba TaxID=504798 RepID=A0A1H0VUJ0_9PSEU|nr:gluconokinase [Actinokineospora alba]TDP70095.1 gluconokinase [Actinokineospora alba]SDI39157.1 gluconokinase [Actinokineospora alba]SDP81756.1 gluconokinase [Actinokineospora alba]
MPVVVVMGVAGSGKSTVASLLAERLGLPWVDADVFHPPANVARMAAGMPLRDVDREPWLAAVADWIAAHSDTGCVVACSALTRRYRDRLRQAGRLWFLHLRGDRALLAERLRGRKGHFATVALLDSQLATLECLAGDESGTEVDVALDPMSIVRVAVEQLA